MSKKELIEKYTVELLSEVAFWEDTSPNFPFFWKAQKIAEGAKVTLEVAEQALKDYQHFMEQ